MVSPQLTLRSYIEIYYPLQIQEQGTGQNVVWDFFLIQYWASQYLQWILLETIPCSSVIVFQRYN